MIGSDRPRPVQPRDRIASLDLLRGFALLGILLMNIQSFAMPMAAYFNPSAYGDLSGANGAVWALCHLFADQKFMTVFSMLFGAGIVLFSDRCTAKGLSPRGPHYRRMFWLLVFGLVHAYVLWAGDILVPYALCGCVVYLFRNRSPRWLIVAGVIVLAIPTMLMTLAYVSAPLWPEPVYEENYSQWMPPAAVIEAEIAAYTGGWRQQMDQRVPQSLAMHSVALVFWSLWRAGGLMLIGMALYRLRVFSAERDKRFYVRLAAIGLTMGLAAVAYGMFENTSRGWEFLYSRFGPGFQFNYWGSLLVSLGYVALVMLWHQSGRLEALRRAVAAVGRTSLTNYLGQTLLATTLLYGHGLGLFGSVERTEQLAIVFTIWAVQLIISPIWLRYFQFGPFEWLWRSLTYMRLQPMRAA